MTDAKNRRGERTLVLALCGALALVGLAVTAALFVAPAKTVIAARSWTPATCEIEWAGTAVWHGVASPAMQYHYDLNGHRYSGRRFRFLDVHLERIRPFEPSDYAVGAKVPCAARPDGGDAVLKPGFTANFLLALFPLMFTAFGFMVIGERLGGSARVMIAAAVFTGAVSILLLDLYGTGLVRAGWAGLTLSGGMLILNIAFAMLLTVRFAFLAAAARARQAGASPSV